MVAVTAAHVGAGSRREAILSRFVGAQNGSGVHQKIISLIPPHDVYIECFAGTGAILRNKRPARRSIAIDLSPGAIDRLENVRSHVTPCEPAGRHAFDSGARSHTGKVGGVVPQLELIVGDGVEYIKRFHSTDPRDVFVYADPPYVRASRSDPDRDYYDHEWDDADHERFLDVVDGLPFPVMISGYESDLYTSRLRRPKWRCSRFMTQTRGGPAEEWLWMNYPTPTRLHDYRFIGDDFPGRWRIHKRQRSWIRMLGNMPELERRAMMAALIAAHGGG